MMKKLFAMLLVCAMMAAVPAVAEELHTFAGIPWDTPLSECEAVLEEKLGVGFNWTRAERPRYMALEPGYYSVLGIRVDARYEDFTVWYDPTEAYENGEVEWEDDAAWQLSEICIEGMEMSGAGAEAIREVWNKLAAQYGEPSRVYFVHVVYDYWNGDKYYPYSVPQEEYDFILEDAVLYAQAEEISYTVDVHFGNVMLECSMYESEDGLPYYSMNLYYYAQPLTPYEENGFEVEAFPMYNGDYRFTVIEPW